METPTKKPRVLEEDDDLQTPEKLQQLTSQVLPALSDGCWGIHAETCVFKMSVGLVMGRVWLGVVGLVGG